MYIGLFIVIPFLNLIYNGLESKKQKQMSLAGLILIVTIPPMINKHFVGTEKLLNVSIPTWTRLYPIMYYFIGAYISEYKPQIKKWLGTASLIGLIGITGTYYYLTNYTGTFAWGDYQDSCAFPIMLLAFVLFVVLSNINLSNANGKVLKVLTHFSELTLGAYLMSYIFDEMIYTELRNAVPDMLDRFYYYPITVLTSFIGAFILSEILSLIYKTFCLIVNKVIKKKCK
jgi:surface polysaccharide O-acyltransferase-like enzyme